MKLVALRGRRLTAESALKGSALLDSSTASRGRCSVAPPGVVLGSEGAGKDEVQCSTAWVSWGGTTTCS